MIAYSHQPRFASAEQQMSVLNNEDRTHLGRMVVNLLDDWGITA